MSIWDRWYARYGLALAIVAAAVLIRAALIPVIGLNVPYLTIYPAMMIVAVIFGVGPGVFATVLGVLLAEVYFMQPGTAIEWNLSLAIRAVILLGASLYVGRIGQILREARRKAEGQAEAAQSAEQAVRRAKEEWERTFDSVPDLIAILDSQHRILRVNRAMAARVGAAPEQCVGQTCYRAVHDMDCAPGFCPHTLTIADGQEHSTEVHEPRLGGDFLVTTVPLRDMDGHMMGSVHVAHDITERKRAEKTLREAKEDLEIRVKERTAELEEARATVEAERQRLYAVLETLPVYVVLLSKDYHVPFANKFFRERFGESRGRCCFDYLFQRTEPCDNCETYKAMKTGQPHHWEWTGPDQRNYDIYDFPFADADGSPMIMEMGIDITERKKAEAALQEAKESLEQRVAERTAKLAVSEARYRSYIEVTDQLGWTTDASGLVVEDLPAWRQYTGQSREEIQGWGWSKALHPDDLERASKDWRKAVQEKRNYETEYRLRRHDGVYRHFLARGVPILNEDGSIREWVGTCIDITERGKAEEALRQSEQRLSRAQEIGHLGSWELDLANNRLTWSDEVYRIFGLQPQEFSATYEAFLERVHPDDRAAVDAAYSNSIRENRDNYEIEHRVVRKDTGEVRFVHEKCEHFRDETGKIIRSVGMVHDITQRKKAEEEIRRVNENLEQFAYVASHDLQEPLRIMASYSQLLERRYKDKLDQEGDDFIGFIVDAVARMQKLITDLLAYSRAGHKDAELADVDCAQVVGRVVENLKATIESAGGSVTLDELPVIRAHEAGMTQLFQNLIGNALKFRREGVKLEVHISAEKVSGFSVQVSGRNARDESEAPASRAEHRTLNTDTWLFRVRDNGIGIEPQYYARVFVIFQRLHPRDKYTGTGIGLSICKRIVENLGGRIWVESEAGKGSTFYFTIPAGGVKNG